MLQFETYEKFPFSGFPYFFSGFIHFACKKAHCEHSLPNIDVSLDS